MKPTAVVLTLAVLCAGCLAPILSPVRPLPDNAVPPRIAVLSFENRSGFTGQWKIGSGMADLLVSELVASRNFVVLERLDLGAVVDELSLQQSGMFRPEGKVDRGRLENAQYLIRGVITDFSQTSGGSLWVKIRKVLLGGGGYTARVGLALTIIDIESGRIVDSVQCAGKARARNAFAQASYKEVHFGGDRFFKTPLGVATTEAIRHGLKGIVKKVPRQYWRPMIAEVKGKEIVLNGGADRGLEVGKLYRVREQSRPVTDPATGDVLERLPGNVIGIVRIARVREKLATATVVNGHGFRRGLYLEPVPVGKR